MKSLSHYPEKSKKQIKRSLFVDSVRHFNEKLLQPDRKK